jgi:hypothetical protein
MGDLEARFEDVEGVDYQGGEEAGGEAGDAGGELVVDGGRGWREMCGEGMESSFVVERLVDCFLGFVS